MVLTFKNVRPTDNQVFLEDSAILCVIPRLKDAKQQVRNSVILITDGIANQCSSSMQNLMKYL